MDVKELAPGVFAVLTADGTANAGFVVGDEQVLVVDTMMLPSQSEELLAAVQRVAPRAPKLVVITHFHGDHTFGNMYFRDSTIMSHHTVRRRIEEGGRRSSSASSGSDPSTRPSSGTCSSPSLPCATATV